jgi:hypothetical protein
MPYPNRSWTKPGSEGDPDIGSKHPGGAALPRRRGRPTSGWARGRGLPLPRAPEAQRWGWCFVDELAFESL